ncbi:MAG: hypothetical protein OZ921_12700 [Sorangiineae bacterium]|nr:hypothetical protein [Polyangiaceae bacterium]MEB2323366.1 hypothetical protein [Sorangiineae bacterium]
MRVVRYGLARDWVLGLGLGLASGEVLELYGALEKNSRVAELHQRFIDSERALGVVTERTLELTCVPSGPDLLVFAIRTLGGVFLAGFGGRGG